MLALRRTLLAANHVRKQDPRFFNRVIARRIFAQVHAERHPLQLRTAFRMHHVLTARLRQRTHVIIRHAHLAQSFALTNASTNLNRSWAVRIGRLYQ